jgi:hypothetical protein
MDNVKLLYTFVWERDSHEKEDIYALVAKNIDQKMDAYLQKILSQGPDRVIKIKMTLERTHKEKFNWSFFLRYSWAKKPLVYIREGFSELNDLVNHAYGHFKLQFSNMKS